MTAEATELSLQCRDCDWCTFPMREAEGAELGWDGFTDADGWTLARAASLVHVALRHPSAFSAGTGRNVEDALASYEAELGTPMFQVVRAMALLDRSRWDKP